MNITLKDILIFTLGTATGAGITYKVLKDKLAADEDARVEKFKADWADRHQKDEEAHVLANENYNKPPITEFSKSTVEKLGYDMPEAEEDVTDEDIEEEVEAPTVIPPTEVGFEEDWDVITFKYYEDGVCTTDDSEVLSDIEIDTLFGSDDVFTRFGEFEEDSVYIRNDERESYYEILKMEGAFYKDEDEE